MRDAFRLGTILMSAIVIAVLIRRSVTDLTQMTRRKQKDPMRKQRVFIMLTICIVIYIIILRVLPIDGGSC